MTNLQGTLDVAQMEGFSECIRRKEKNYKIYCQLFASFELGT